MFKQAIVLTCAVWVGGLAGASAARAGDPGLVGWCTFDEGAGATAVDSSHNGNDGMLMNGPAWVPGKLDGGLRLDGWNDYVETNNTGNLANWTVPVWVTSPAAPAV